MEDYIYLSLVVFLVVSSFSCTFYWIIYFNTCRGGKDYITLDYDSSYDRNYINSHDLL
jgi:hypothetical protein